MQIATIIANINAIIARHDELAYDDDPVKKIFTCYVITKLKNILLKMRGSNPYKHLGQEQAKILLNFYKEIYATISNTDVVAPHNPHSLLTGILLSLATQIANILGLNKFQILLPSIVITEYEATTRSLNDPDLKLTDFILSDDGYAIIEVYDSLSQASIHGEPKHTYLVDGQQKLLSQAEQDRVINHSAATVYYWEAIRNRIDITLHGESFGAVLNRLCESLLDGGANGTFRGAKGGVHLNSGEAANVGVAIFFNWYNTLSEKDRSRISNIPDLDEAIGTLLPPKNHSEVEYKNATTYCVELIANAIKNILKVYPELYEMYPENTLPEYTSGLEEANVMVAQAESSLLHALQNGNYEVTATYGSEAYIYFLHRVVAIPDLLKIISKKTLNSMFAPHLIASWLERQNMRDRCEYLISTSAILNQITFPNLLSGTKILELFSDIGDLQLVIKTLKKQFHELVKSKHDLDLITASCIEMSSEQVSEILFGTKAPRFLENTSLTFTAQKFKNNNEKSYSKAFFKGYKNPLRNLTNS